MTDQQIKDQPVIEIIELEIEKLPEAANDQYDGCLHISPRAHTKKYTERSVNKRSSYQAFTFD